MQTYAYDLGIYNQAVHSTLTGKSFLYYTADLTANPSGSIFGVHVAFILLIITPFYALLPCPQTLLVMQSVVLAFGAVPVYFLSKYKLQSKNIGLIFSSIYLLSPLVQGINWYDFHPEAFIILPILCAFYFAEKNRPFFYFVSIIFVLLAMDKAAILIVFFGFYKLVSLKKNEIFKKPTLNSLNSIYIATIIPRNNLVFVYFQTYDDF